MSTQNLAQLLACPMHHDFAESELPSGSGFDAGTTIESCSLHKIVLKTSFHHMDHNGYYCGWSEHKIVIVPTFDGFVIKCSGKNMRDIKEYICDTFYEVLSIRYSLEWNNDTKTFSYTRI